MTVLKKKILLTFIFVTFLVIAVFASIKMVNVEAMSNYDPTSFKYYTSYEIQPGDTLVSIAENHINGEPISIKEYISEVKTINKLSSDKITSGKNIIIIYYSDEYK